MSACATCGHDPAKYLPRFTEADHARMEKLYRGGQSIASIAALMECAYTTVRDTLVARDVPRRGHSGRESS